jgi:hypothetical protein
MSTGVLGQPLGPPSQLDLAVFTTRILEDWAPFPLDTCIDFGAVQLIPDNKPAASTYLGL